MGQIEPKKIDSDRGAFIADALVRDRFVLTSECDLPPPISIENLQEIMFAERQ
jgi:hypothetical protein